jgi:hypothetical protein
MEYAGRPEKRDLAKGEKGTLPFIGNVDTTLSRNPFFSTEGNVPFFPGVFSHFTHWAL